MTEPNQLTDRTALNRNRARAFARPDAALFLHELAASEVKERLELVNRSFTTPAVISALPRIWADVVAGAQHVPDADILDLAEGAHDLVIHAMSLHWANDPVGQLVQCRRALKPDGLFIAALMGGHTLAELRAALAEAESRLTGGLSPRVLPMGEIRDLGGLLQRAGFALPVADSTLRTASYRDAFHLMSDLRAMGEANALAARPRHVSPRGLFIETARIYADAFKDGENRVSATFETIFLTGWAPDPSQPQPLRPGSAEARLADALNTTETPLADPAPRRRV